MTKEVRQETDPVTGLIVEERHLLNGRFHRDASEGPAYIKRDRKSRVVVREVYYFEGRRHREGGPAEIRRNSVSGVAVEELYCLHGRKHREDGPAIIHRDLFGNLLHELWCLKGYSQRDSTQGPTLRRIDPDTGVVFDEVYREKIEGRRTERAHLHRIGGPANIDRDRKTGVAVNESYYVSGELHRPRHEGPAVIERDPKTGEIIKQEFFENGVKIEMPVPGRPATPAGSTRSPGSDGPSKA